MEREWAGWVWMWARVTSGLAVAVMSGLAVAAAYWQVCWLALLRWVEVSALRWAAGLGDAALG